MERDAVEFIALFGNLCCDFPQVIQAYNKVLDLKEKHVDILVLEILVDGVCSSDAEGDLKKKAEQLFNRLTQQVSSLSSLSQINLCVKIPCYAS
jgi:hypothetical protein